MMDGWLLMSECVFNWDVPLGLGTTALWSRGEGGGFVTTGLRGVPGDPVEGDGIGGRG